MKSKVKIKKINNYILKTKLTPDMKNKNNTLWLFSFAIGKSIHQINDWLNQRKNKRATKLTIALTGKSSIAPQIFALRQLRQYINELKQGDIIFFRCESKENIKQFNVWKKWFTRRECKHWIIDENYLLFYYIKTKQAYTNPNLTLRSAI